MNFPEKLQSLRKMNNMSQEDLAEKLNVTRQTISKWESQQSTPDLDKLINISNIFEVSLDYLSKPDELDDLTMRTERLEKNQEELLKKRKKSRELKHIVISTVSIYMIAAFLYALGRYFFYMENPFIAAGAFVFTTAIVLLVNKKRIADLY